MINLKNILLIVASSTNYRSNRRDSIKYIVIHYTGNNGDTARNNCNYFQGSNKQASAHCFVDENEVCQSVPFEYTAWHCGVDYSNGNAPFWGLCTNDNSIGIEMCNSMDYVPQATQDRVIELVKTLMATYNIPVENVIRHYDVCYKECPAPFVSDSEQWNNFKVRLGGSYVSNSTQSVTGLLKVGSTGDAVKHIQVELGITADGIFGSQTESAVKNFQAKCGLVVDGIVGSATLNALSTPQNGYYPYEVQIITDVLYIRSGASTSFSIVGTIEDRGKYHIVDEQNGFGKLLSGKGWISLKYTERT